MANESLQKKPKLSDYMYVLYKWKKFLFVNLLIVSIITVVLVLLMPNQYKSTATVMIPPEDQSAFGGLSSLLGGKSSIASMGSRLFGVSNTSEDVLLGIINSRSALTKFIHKFDLVEYYEIDDGNMDKVLKAFRDDIITDPNEYGMIEISIVNEDPQVSADIANYIISFVDSANIAINVERAKQNKEFIEKRYLQNVADLRNAEDSLYLFQKKFGIVAVPEQLEVTIKAAAEIESELIKKEMQAYFVVQQYGKGSPQYQGINAEVTLLREKVNELKNSTNLSASSNILFPFNKMPDIAISYMRFYREIEIQQSILEFVMPMYEQAKVEEQKSIPTIVVIDEAVPAQLKYSPKRSAIVIGVFLLFSFILVPFVFVGEKAVSRKTYENPLQQKEANFMNKIVKFYRMKF